MTNAALQAMINELGDRICIIAFDNNSKVYIGYPASTIKSVSELQFKTFGDTDMVGVPKKTQNGLMTTTWHVTSCIQVVATVDEGFEKFLIDPMELG